MISCILGWHNIGLVFEASTRSAGYERQRVTGTASARPSPTLADHATRRPPSIHERGGRQFGHPFRRELGDYATGADVGIAVSRRGRRRFCDTGRENRHKARFRFQRDRAYAEHLASKALTAAYEKGEGELPRLTSTRRFLIYIFLHYGRRERIACFTESAALRTISPSVCEPPASSSAYAHRQSPKATAPVA